MNPTKLDEILLKDDKTDSEEELVELHERCVAARKLPVYSQMPFIKDKVKAILEMEQEAGRAPKIDDKDGFFNSAESSYAIQKEGPQHRLVIYMRARGHTAKEIAEATGLTPTWVREIVKQPWAKARIVDEINKAGRDELANTIEAAAKESLYSLIDIRDSEAPAAVRANVSQYLVDRFLGKPKSTIVQTSGNPSELTDEQLARVIAPATSGTGTTPS